MELLQNSTTKRYGIIVSKTINGNSILEEYMYNGLTIRLPMGELLFTVVESYAYLQKPYSVQDVFLDREYSLEGFFDGFVIDDTELSCLQRIIDFISAISNQKASLNLQTLKALFFSLYPGGHKFFYLFNSSDKYRIRRICSKIPLPFGQTTKYIYHQLNEKYARFSFQTITEIQTLTDLCVLSLFEILESGQFIRCCQKCHRYFVSDGSTHLCNRPATFNDHKGCKKQKCSDYNKQYRKAYSIKEYKKVYNKLHMRANKKNQTINDIKNFEDFKREWALLKIQFHNSPDLEERKMKFLQSERWK